MKKRIIIVNLLMAVAVLFSILFQSLHSFEHFEQHASEKCAHYKDPKGKNVLSHSHHKDNDSDKCFVCEFNFSSFIRADALHYQLFPGHKTIPYFPGTSEVCISHSGCDYLLRGPPVS